MRSSDPNLGSSDDVVFLRGLALTAFVGPDTWHRLGKSQPVLLDLRMQTSIVLAGDTDDVLKTIHYGNLCRAVTKATSENTFDDLGHLANTVCSAAFDFATGGMGIELRATLPKALLLADGLTLSTVRSFDGERNEIVSHSLQLSVAGLKLACIIGVNPHERLEKQQVLIDLKFHVFGKHLLSGYGTVVKAVADGVEKSSFETLEAMATYIGKIVCENGVEKVTVSVQKPSALMFVGGSGVEITRTVDFYHKGK